MLGIGFGVFFWIRVVRGLDRVNNGCRVMEGGNLGGVYREMFGVYVLR